MTSASQVSELFIKAGQAFTKLAELGQVIQNSTEKTMNGDYFNDSDAPCWTVHDTESLHNAVKRFGDDLNEISAHIKEKTMSQIKSTFKKLSTAGKCDTVGGEGNTNSPSSSSLPGSRFQDIKDLSTTDHADSSGAAIISKADTKLNNNMTNEIASGPADQLKSSKSTPSTSTAATSICASPSPFLHFRKSADITLNMLNARDDSDDEDRKTGLSVFNSA